MAHLLVILFIASSKYVISSHYIKFASPGFLSLKLRGWSPTSINRKHLRVLITVTLAEEQNSFLLPVCWAQPLGELRKPWAPWFFGKKAAVPASSCVRGAAAAIPSMWMSVWFVHKVQAI